MYDRQTNSLWSQFLSVAVRGPLAGTRLEPVPVSLTTWEAWTSEHPDSKVLWKPSRTGTFDVYEGYYESEQAGVLGRQTRDDRLPKKELVLGTGFDTGAKAFPHSVLEKQPVLNDTVAGEPALVWFDRRTGTAVAYLRQLEDRTLTFEAVPDHGGFPLITDQETGTRWSPLTGVAVEGPLAGKMLERIHAMNAFWFAWADFYPDTELYLGS